MNKNKNIKSFYIKLALFFTFILIIAVMGVICLNGRTFSRIKYDKQQNCYIYKDSRYYVADSQNYYIYEKKDKIGRIWGNSFYTICNDEAENVIVVTGSRDVTFLVKENVKLGVGGHITGVFFSKGTASEYRQKPELLKRLEALETLCTQEAKGKEVTSEIEVKLCYNDIPVAVETSQYCIGYCDDYTWVLLYKKNDTKMYELTDIQLIDELRSLHLSKCKK